MSTKAPAVTLEYVKTIGIVNNGDNGRGFANPYDIAVTRDGRICVLNRCDPPRALSIRVGICNLDEEYLGEFRLGYGAGDGQVTLPVCLAFDSRERLHVTDENNHRVSVFDLSGKFLDRWGSPGSGDGELDGAAGIAIDSNDDVYVADQHNHRIQKFDRDGVYLSQWGSRGSGAGQLDMPWGLAVDREDNVYVADWRNDRVQKFSSEGRFLASFGSRDGATDSSTGPPASPSTPTATYTCPTGATSACRSSAPTAFSCGTSAAAPRCRSGRRTSSPPTRTRCPPGSGRT